MTHISITPSTARYLGPAYMVLAGALFALSNTAVQSAGMTYGAPPPTIAFWQYAIATAFAAPLIFRSAWRTNRIWLHVARVLLAVCGVQAWVAGLATVPIWQAIALLLTSPLFVTLGACLFLGEKLGAARLLAVIFGAIGGAIILAPWTDAFRMTALLPIAAAALWAGSSLLTKHLSRTESVEVLTVYLLALILPFNGIAALGAGFLISGPAMWIVLAAGLATAVAQYALAKAYTLSDAAYLQPFDHLKLPFNVALGIAVFGFAPPGSMWLGAVIIVGASAWLLRQDS